jgi:hypothetical protein
VANAVVDSIEAVDVIESTVDGLGPETSVQGVAGNVETSARSESLPFPPSSPKELQVSWPVRFLLAAVILLTLPAAAKAATPFTAGSGGAPSVAVGSDGTGHVVWITDSTNDQVGYCRISAGAEACNRTELLNFGASTEAHDAGRAQVFTPAPNRVVVVGGCWNCPDQSKDRTYRWISNDNGESFDVGTEIGDEFATEGFGVWLDDLGIFVGASERLAKAAAPDGVGVEYAPDGLFVYGPEIARVPGTTKLVAATNDLEVVKFGVYNGVGPHTITSFNTSGNWLIDRLLPSPEPDNGDTALNSGPNGVFLSYEHFVAGDSHIGLRRFDPVSNTFGGPIYVEGGNAIDNGPDYPDSFQDPSGRIHFVWRSLYDGGRLRYTVSDTAGSNFNATANLAKTEDVYEPEIAAGADGKGFVAWTAGTIGPVRVVPIDPTPEPIAAAPVVTPPDVTRPSVLGSIGIGDRTLLPGQSTTFSFRSSEAGLAVLTFEKRFKGVKGKRKGKKTCLPATKKRLRALRKKAGTPRAYRKLLKKRSCKGWKRIGEIRQRVSAGANSIAFNGRIAGRKLTKGQYRGRLVITDAAGLASRTETIKFKVVAKKTKKRVGRR